MKITCARPTNREWIAFSAGILSLTVMLCAPFSSSYQWPPGIGWTWYAVAAATGLALVLDVVWLLRARRWEIGLALLMLFFVLATVGPLAQPFLDELAHRR